MIAKGELRRFLDRKLDSFTWMKKLSRDEILEEIATMKVHPIFKGDDRYTCQLVCFWIGMCCPEFLFLLDMGLGKTTIILDLMLQYQREKKIGRALVTVKNLVNFDSWINTTARFSDLEPSVAEGSIEEKFEALIHPKGDFTLIDYQGLHLALCTKARIAGKNKLIRDDKKINQVRKVYQMFAGDELHKSKNKDTLRFSILRYLTKPWLFRFGTTGTPFGRNPMDLWALFYIVDHGATFGDTIGLFREALFHSKDGYWGGTTYEFDKAMTRALYRMLQHRSIRYSDDEVPEVELPRLAERREVVKFTTEQREHYLRAVEGLLMVKGNMREMDNAFLRLRQITSGYLSWKEDDEKHTVYFRENHKLDATERLVDECGDSKIVISTEFTNTGKIIVRRLTDAGHKVEWLYGGSKDPRAVARTFINNPEVKVLVMNSEAGGTGTDGLQEVANYLVFYESPSSPITRQQVLKRIHRPGQLKRTHVIDVVLEKSVDLRLLTMIQEGRDLHDAVVNGRITRGDLL